MKYTVWCGVLCILKKPDLEVCQMLVFVVPILCQRKRNSGFPPPEQ